MWCDLYNPVSGTMFQLFRSILFLSKGTINSYLAVMPHKLVWIILPRSGVTILFFSFNLLPLLGHLFINTTIMSYFKCISNISLTSCDKQYCKHIEWLQIIQTAVRIDRYQFSLLKVSYFFLKHSGAVCCYFLRQIN